MSTELEIARRLLEGMQADAVWWLIVWQGTIFSRRPRGCRRRSSMVFTRARGILRAALRLMEHYGPVAIRGHKVRVVAERARGRRP